MFTMLENVMDVEEAMVEAGHNFEVEKRPVLYQDEGLVRLEANHFVTVRKDTGSALGVVGNRYEIHQPREMWDFVDDFAKVSNGKIKKSFILDGGARLGAVIELGTVQFTDNDIMFNNFIIYDSHDGSKAFLGMPISERIVCTNQLHFSTEFFKIRHTLNIGTRIASAKRMLNFYTDQQEVFNEKMRFLVNNKITKREAVKWFSELFPEPKQDRGKTVLENKVIKFKQLLETGRGVTDQIKGTGYWAINGLSEFVNHEQTIRTKGKDESEARFRSVMFGSGGKLMQKGFDSLLKAIA